MTTERQIRRWASRRRRTLAQPDTAYGQCYIESTAFEATHVGWLLIRTTGQNYPGREHWAVIEWDEDLDPSVMRVVDLTARQFDATVDYPWIGTLLDWYDLVLDWQGDNINVEVHADAADDVVIWRDAYDREDIAIDSPMMKAWAS